MLNSGKAKVATQGRSHTSKKLLEKADGNQRRSPLSQRNLQLVNEASAARGSANAETEGDGVVPEQE